MKNSNFRTYIKEECIVFKKTHEEFGGLSNMASGYNIKINNINILTSEALYQSCRYPHLSKVQKLIISERSPMTAKMVSKKYTKETRSDWNEVRINVMRWVLRVKLINNFDTFGDLLRKTGEKNIVEESRKDDFWGAKLQSDGTLVGENVLGRLLMELRKQYFELTNKQYVVLRPLSIKDFRFLDEDILPVRIKINNMNVDYEGINRNKETQQISFLKMGAK
ncbi:NADAR family protein [Clostridium butyricum]|uniref:NADAR family protein n=1 Tax=Clostridium butyricum TaxID=1492 RepID=UPI0021C3019A|nr:NADAR family protein [Clostridium butyricum]MCQ2012341.1 NADAR family protein [Clostridium butyricum]